MPIDPLGKAILETLMGDPVSITTLRMQCQFVTKCQTQDFWQRLDTLEEMHMVDATEGGHRIELTPKGRAFYLADGVVDTESTP